jgi:nitroreductase
MSDERAGGAMDLWDAIDARHSVRHFRPDPVSRAVVERCVDAARHAPSSMNEQPWEFYCCRGESRTALGGIIAQATVHLSEYMEMLGPKRYEDAVEWFSSLGDAPVLIAVSCLSPDSEFSAMNRYLSIGSAVENFLLAATAQGLGSCSITFSHWVKDEMAELLGVPEGSEVVSVIALGYPSDVPTASPEKREHIAVWLD